MGLKRTFFALCLSSLILNGCSSSPDRADTRDGRALPDDAQTIAQTDPYRFIDEAEKAFNRTGDASLRNQWLLRAADAFQARQSCTSTRKIVRLLLPELQADKAITHARLLLAECELNEATPDIELLDTLMEGMTSQVGFNGRISKVQSHVAARQHRWLDAALALAQSDLPEAERVTGIWQYLQHLDAKELERARLREAALQPYIQLSLIVRRFGLQPDALASAVSEWQNRFATHPLASNLPQELEAVMVAQPHTPQRVAVLLPLTGRLALQGQAIKEGLLAAYFEQQTDKRPEQHSIGARPAQLHFIDTDRLSVDTIAHQADSYDFVIGPLMKDKIVRVVSRLPSSLPILALNRIDEADLLKQADQLDDSAGLSPFSQGGELSESQGLPVLTEDFGYNGDSIGGLDQVQDFINAAPSSTNRYYFALAPEDEAEQLAVKVLASGARHPIVVAHDSATMRRMAESFINTWNSQKAGLMDDSSTTNDAKTQEQTLAVLSRQPESPKLALFKNNEAMRVGVAELLDVAQSKARIKQVSRLLTEKLHAVPRNRKDIDAIVVFANAQQTELLNPIIEASQSPFNDEVIPVYASSRSYSLDLNQNSLRDLRNLTFTDMPWMLPSHDWQALASMTEALWPERDDTLRRLFALGYDAYTLVPHLKYLKLLPQLSVQGLTGQLSLNERGQVKRQMPYGHITNDEVIRIAME